MEGGTLEKNKGMTKELHAQLREWKATGDGLQLQVDDARGQLAVIQASLEDLKVQEATSLESGHHIARDLQVLRSHQECLEAVSRGV